MNVDQFWQIVERVHAVSPRNMAVKCHLLAEELRALPPGEIQSFDRHFTDCEFRAYSKDLWGAAFVINNGCGDTGFMDFCSTLISLGRSAFENALRDPESLAEVDIDRAWARYEGYQYVAHTVHEQITGNPLPNYSSPYRAPLAGTPFQEWAMLARYPKLVAKYGFKDSDWLSSKEQAEKSERWRLSAEHFAKFLLDSGIIPSCGMIPPVRVVRRALREGRISDANGRQRTWEPIDLDEGDYWGASSNLEKLTPDELRSRAEIHSEKLKVDLNAPQSDDYGVWLESLRQRGLM
jgi:Protein of unknown function (DUF4240)